MSEAKNRLKRQIELLGLIIAEPCKYKIVDLELYFNCTQITIKRDFSELRSMGIDIHSVSQKGIKVNGNISQDIVKNLLTDYIIVSGIDSFYQRSLHFYTDKFKECSIPNFTRIQTSIENNFKIKIEYHKKDGVCEDKIIDPLLIFLNENEWRLVANNDGKIKQFLISKIQHVKVLDRNFPEELKLKAKKYLCSSFGSWISEDSIEVKIKFTKDWLATGKEPKMMEYQEIFQEKDGSKIVSFKTNSLEDVARWIVGRGGEVIVIEPESLRKMVIEIAKKSVNSHILLQDCHL